MKGNLLILGAGAYGNVAKEIAVATKQFRKIDFLDDAAPCAIGKLEDYATFVKTYPCAVVAVGNPKLRLEYIEKLLNAGYDVVNLFSPQSYVSPSAKIGKGCIVEPMAVVNANTELGTGVIVCAGAIVNHNSIVKDGCQLDCGCVVAARAIMPPMTKLENNFVYIMK